jgi:predicted DNA-binding protein (UPF0251 family)
MQPETFDALARLLALQASPTRAALRAVLVDLMPQRAAATAHGITYQTLRDALTSWRKKCTAVRQCAAMLDAAQR